MATIPASLQRNEIVETEIAGHVYKIEKLGAKKGKTVIAGLARVVGPAFDGENVIEKLCSALTDAQLDSLCDTFAKQTRYSPADKPEAEFLLDQTFDKHFSGHYGTMVLWLKACLEANYGNFLDELGVGAASLKDLFLAAMTKAMNENGTMAVPTGSSIASSLRASGA